MDPEVVKEEAAIEAALEEDPVVLCLASCTVALGCLAKLAAGKGALSMEEESEVAELCRMCAERMRTLVAPPPRHAVKSKRGKR